MGKTNGDGICSQAGIIKETETEEIDLVGALEQPTVQDNSDSLGLVGLDDDEADPLSSDVRADIFPESKRFTIPKTPATQGTKRKRDSQTHSQQIQTPQLPTNPFAGYTVNSELLGPSQLFKTTQALTSPLNVVSDGLSDRPSPDIHKLQRPSTSDTLSSPVELPRANMVRAVTEPQTTYVSVRESQEARERLLQARGLDQRLSPEELSDGDFDSADTQLRKRLNKKRMVQAVRNQFAGVTARPQPPSNIRRRKLRSACKQHEIHSSSLRSGQQAGEAVLISDDPPLDEVQGNITEDETEREEEGVEEKPADDMDELAEENKENVEVPMTVSRLGRTSAHTIASQPSPPHHPPQRSNRVTRAYQRMLATSSPSANRSPERTVTSANTSQAFAVADSQSSQHQTQMKTVSRRTQRDQHVPSSSLDSRPMVPQSQVFQIPKSSTVPCNSSEAQIGDNITSTTNPSSMRSRKESPTDTNSRRSNQTQIDIGGNIDDQQAHNKSSKQITNGTSHGGSSMSMPLPKSLPRSASGTGAGDTPTGPSNPLTLYETAREQLIDSPSRSHVQRVQQASRSEKSSPPKSQRWRPIEEINAVLSPPDLVGAIDLNISLVDEDDIDFQACMRPPSPKLPILKRRRGIYGLSSQSKKTDYLGPGVSFPSPSQLRNTPKSPPSSAFSNLTPPRTSSETDTRSPMTATTTNRLSAKEGTLHSKAAFIPAQKAPAAQVALPDLRKVQQRAVQDDLPIPVVTSSTNLKKSSVPTDVLQPFPRKAAESPSTVTVVAPNRVFGHFNGSLSAFYPATCTGVVAGDEPRYEVTFDDGVKDTISGFGIKRLELRAGDVCKVDLPGARTKNFVVEGMQCQQRHVDPNAPSLSRLARSTLKAASHETDIYGYDTVLVSAKQRKSLGGGQAPAEQIVVALSQVYFTQAMWTALKDRAYTFILSKQPILTGLQTPSERPSTPSTPSSRARRVKNSGMVSSHPADVAKASDALFTGMIFTLTNIAVPESLQRTKIQIISNGGRILDNGFDELFHVPNLSRISSPARNKDTSFHLTPSAQSLGFTCLVADRHCRRAKYIQALALGIPCVAIRWITDCISKQSLLPIAAYLLPSGESAFLKGAIRSRVLDPVPDPATATLSSLVSNRPLMLTNTSILLIMQKYEEQTMKHHNFLTHALGASHVSKVTSTEAAAKAIKEARANGEPWDWVYTHDREKETEKAIFGNLATRKKRRGRNASGGGGDGIGKGMTRVVGNEFIIQSLILGQLADG